MNEDLARKLVNIEGQTIVIEAERDAATIARDGADKSFSAEAVEQVAVECQQWILSRIVRRFKRENMAAHKMEVEITVKLDGESLDVLSVPFKLTFIDGEYRRKAAG